MIFRKKITPKSHRTRLGDLLIKNGANRDKVDAAMATYYEKNRNRSGEYCVEVGACTRGQLDLALSEQAIERGDYEEAGGLVSKTINASHTGAMGSVDAIAEQIAILISQ